MKSGTAGRSISNPEVSHISIHGIWLLFKQKEYFLPFEHFPWFKNARISEVQNVQNLHGNHIYWPDIDVDLSVSILEDVESYPLVWK